MACLGGQADLLSSSATTRIFIRANSVCALQADYRLHCLCRRPWQGALICWLGTTLAALVVFTAVRTLFRDKGRAYLKRVPALERFNRVMEREPFAAVLLARLIPVIPQAAVNVYAGVAGFPFWSFILGTAIGKLPAIAVYAYAGGTFAEHPITGLLILVLYTALVGGAFILYRKRL